MKSLVTGGGGFLGKQIVRKLLERGDDVTVIGRNHYPDVETMGAKSLPIDIRSLQELIPAFVGMDEVYHAAGVTDIWGPWEIFYSINVLGTQNVVEACRKNNVPKLIYTSSPSVVFDAKPQKNVNEDAPYPEKWLAHYPHSKMLAEKCVMSSNEEGRLSTVSLRPHLIWGPGDLHLIPRVVSRARSGQLRQVGDGENLVDIIHVENAADAHLFASKELGPGGKCNGKTYFVSQGQPVRLWDFIEDVLERAGAPKVKKSVSFASAYRAGSALEWVYKAMGKKKEPRMTRFLACQLAMDHYYDTTRAKEDFGYHPTITTEEGLKNLF